MNYRDVLVLMDGAGVLSTGACSCGHPDGRHRAAVEISGRVNAGELAHEVLAEYGMPGLGPDAAQEARNKLVWTDVVGAMRATAEDRAGPPPPHPDSSESHADNADNDIRGDLLAAAAVLRAATTLDTEEARIYLGAAHLLIGWAMSILDEIDGRE